MYELSDVYPSRKLCRDHSFHEKPNLWAHRVSISSRAHVSLGLMTTNPETELALFLKSLAEEGRAVISPQPLADDVNEALSVLRQMDTLARQEFVLALPEFTPAAALWAARLFYNLCQFTVCRDIGEERVVAACRVSCPSPRGPETDWSVDLVLRHLPQLFQFARHLSNADPLVHQMREIAITWPLSSVGIAGLENVHVDSFISHAGLRRLYADRIILEGDTCRLGDGRVDEMLRGDFGVHRELAPALAARLFATT